MSVYLDEVQVSSAKVVDALVENSSHGSLLTFRATETDQMVSNETSTLTLEPTQFFHLEHGNGGKIHGSSDGVDASSDSSSSSTDSSDESGGITSTDSMSSTGSGSTDRPGRKTSEPPNKVPMQSPEDVAQMQPGWNLSCEYAVQTQTWTRHVPIGLGLCPWAGQAHCQGRLRYVTCEGDAPDDVAELLLMEAGELTVEKIAPLTSTLIVCPHVMAWKDFEVFENWVKSGIKEELRSRGIDELVTLVPFHPEFLRWRGLPEGVVVGSDVLSYRGMAGRKSLQPAQATVIDTRSTMFGMQRIKVRFHDGVEQFVPIDWFEQSVGSEGAPLPDNAMHRAPYPTVHLINNRDLSNLCISDVSRIKRRNAQRMMKLGWKGVERRLKELDMGTEADQ